MLTSIIIGIIAGIISNFVTHYILSSIRDNSIVQGSEKIKNWISQIKWNVLPLLLVFVTLYFIKFHWPLNWSVKILIIISIFIVTNGMMFGLEYIKSKSKFSLSFSFIMIIIMMICLFYILDGIFPNYISISCPKKVGNRTTLQGRIIDIKYHVFILVRPRSSNSTYVERASTPGRDGKWYGTFYFGGGSGEKFEVYAVAISDDKKLPDNPEVLPEPEWIEENAMYKTDICIVTKE